MTFYTSAQLRSFKKAKLQQECRRANLEDGGSVYDLRKRLQTWSNELDEFTAQRRKTKKQKTTNNKNNNKEESSIEGDLVCPITHELPFHPVTAEDGRIYERSAIEAHIKSRRGHQLRSPMTNDPMGPRLVAAPWQKNVINSLVQNGTISGELAETWGQKVEQQKAMDALQAKAEGGDADAMFDLGVNFENGIDGFMEDPKMAHSWYEKAHKAGSIKGTAFLGFNYLFEDYVERNVFYGSYLLTMAAERGSDYAAFQLAEIFREGDCGMEKDNALAIKWFERALDPDCPHKHLLDEHRTEAQEKLDELKNISD